MSAHEDNKLVGKPVYLALVIRDPQAFRTQNLIGQTFAGMEITQICTNPAYLDDAEAMDD